MVWNWMIMSRGKLIVCNCKEIPRTSNFLHAFVIFRSWIMYLQVKNLLLCSEGGFFNAIMSFPQNYPNSPPQVRFTSDMWHPNGWLILWFPLAWCFPWNLVLCWKMCIGWISQFIQMAGFAYQFFILLVMTQMATSLQVSDGVPFIQWVFNALELVIFLMLDFDLWSSFDKSDDVWILDYLRVKQSSANVYLYLCYLKSDWNFERKTYLQPLQHL